MDKTDLFRRQRTNKREATLRFYLRGHYLYTGGDTSACGASGEKRGEKIVVDVREKGVSSRLYCSRARLFLASGARVEGAPRKKKKSKKRSKAPKGFSEGVTAIRASKGG